MSAWGDNVAELMGDIHDTLHAWKATGTGSAYEALDRWMGEEMYRPADCRYAHEQKVLTQAAAAAEAGGDFSKIAEEYSWELVRFWWPMMTEDDESAKLEEEAVRAGFVSTYNAERDPDSMKVAERAAAARIANL